MLLGSYVITEHVVEQYNDRCKRKTKKDIIKSIKFDLRTLNIKQIIRDNDYTYVFTYGYKEFIFFRKPNGKLILKTFIKRNREDTDYVIEKRKRRALIAK